jgi:hypothetical protein
MSPTVVLKKFFGLKDGQTLTEFAAEVRILHEDEAAYTEVVDLAAAELGEKVEYATTKK